MYSPKIDEALIPVLYKKAKEAKVPMTRFVDCLIRTALETLNELKDKPIVKNCSNCLAVIDADDGQDEAYCEKCESLVFLERRAV
jgi:DNA-directed RNA polymerase subunit RPC12/RpoP